MFKFYLNMKTNPERASAIDNRCRQLNIHIDRFDATVVRILMKTKNGII